MKRITLIALLSLSLISANCGALLNRTSVTNSNSQNFTGSTNTNSSNVKSDYQIKQERDSARTTWISDKTTELTKLPKSSKITKQPYINNLAVAFYKAESDESFTSADKYIPVNAKAYTDDEARTVILIKEKSQFYGNYRVTGKTELVPAYTIYNEVIIIDRSIPAIIYRKTFAGKQPANNVTLYGDDSVINGESPEEKVLEFLKKLPLK